MKIFESAIIIVLSSCLGTQMLQMMGQMLQVMSLIMCSVDIDQEKLRCQDVPLKDTW